MAVADFPVADPASFAAEPITAAEVMMTDPRQVARVVNVYARVLAEHGLSGHVERSADAEQDEGSARPAPG